MPPVLADASPPPGLPAYARVRAALLHEVETGRYKPGNRFPSENELAPRFGVSVGTIRHSLGRLVNEGVLVRKQGLGTFVATTRLAAAQVRYYQFLRGPAKPIADVAIKVQTIRGVGKGPWQEFLSEDPKGYVQVRRVVTVGEAYRVYCESYLPATRFAPMLKMPPGKLNGVTLYSYLERRFATPTLKNEHFVSLTPLPAAAREVLRTRGLGCLWEFVALTYRDTPIEYRRSYLSHMPLRLRLGYTTF